MVFVFCLSKELIKQVLSQRQGQVLCIPGCGSSAVLCTLYEKEGQWQFLFTKRTTKVLHHKGQISFPGGARDLEDVSLLETALRETFEETGLHRDDVEICGALDDVETHTSNFIITPFVAMLSYPYPFRLNRDEVQELVSVPVQALVGKERFGAGSEVIEGVTYPGYFYEYQGRFIWGATARIVKQFLEIFYPRIQE